MIHGQSVDSGRISSGEKGGEVVGGGLFVDLRRRYQFFGFDQRHQQQQRLKQERRKEGSWGEGEGKNLKRNEMPIIHVFIGMSI